MSEADKNWDDFPWNVEESKRLIEIIIKQSQVVVDAILYYEVDIGCSQLYNALKDLSKLREDY
tara:strand:- start:1046 stop:1234 length:189 start_codon:yes stop_codon:yes gene_type:complete